MSDPILKTTMSGAAITASPTTDAKWQRPKRRVCSKHWHLRARRDSHPREPDVMESDKLYAALIRLYPAAFREEYGREMRAAFRQRRRDEPNALRRTFLWISVFADTFI